jgi:hypothetical protein
MSGAATTRFASSGAGVVMPPLVSRYCTTVPPITNGRLRAAAAGIAGKENHAHAANDILQWNVAHGSEDTAVAGVVAVVAKHEQVTGGHGEAGAR